MGRRQQKASSVIADSEVKAALRWAKTTSVHELQNDSDLCPYHSSVFLDRLGGCGNRLLCVVLDAQRRGVFRGRPFALWRRYSRWQFSCSLQ